MDFMKMLMRTAQFLVNKSKNGSRDNISPSTRWFDFGF